MANWIAAGLIGGLAAVVLQAAVLYPSPLTAFLFYLSALPIFVAGLGWGAAAAVVAGLSGTLALGPLAGPTPAVAFLLGVAVPPTVLTWLALRSRPAGPAPGGEGEAQAQGLQWYPEGRLVLWAAAMAAALTGLGILVVAPDAEGFRSTVEGLLREMLSNMAADQSEISRGEIERMATVMATLLPIAAASIWLLATIINMRLGAKLLAAFDRAPRPWARFGALTFPRQAAWLLPVSVVAALLPGTLGLIGLVFASAMFTAFALAGLAVLHGLTEGMSLRGLVLAALYAALALLNWVLVIPLAALAVADMTFGLRARAAGGPPADPS